MTRPDQAETRTRGRDGLRYPIRGWSAAALVAVAGCVTEHSAPDPVRNSFENVPSREERQAALALEPFVEAEPAGSSYSARVVAEVQSRGTIPYDRMSLPQVSPDGRYIVTEVGLAPTWDTVLALSGASFPGATRLEIYRIEDGTNAPPRLWASAKEAGLLGRSCDEQGFLVESPQPDGSRHIGLASWETGEVAWLVADDRVNAFATLGPRGELAWSRRAVTGQHWELVVRAGGEEWSVTGQGGDWLYPTWSGLERGLFIVHLRDGELELVFTDATDRDATVRVVDSRLLAYDCDHSIAYQTIGPTITVAGMPPPVAHVVSFHHPARIGAAIWTPGREPFVFPHNTYGVVLDADDPSYALVTDERNLQRRLLSGADSAYSNLIAGMHVPRRTTNPLRPWLLLHPRNNRVAITVMRLLPADTVVE